MKALLRSLLLLAALSFLPPSFAFAQDFDLRGLQETTETGRYLFLLRKSGGEPAYLRGSLALPAPFIKIDFMERTLISASAMKKNGRLYSPEPKPGQSEQLFCSFEVLPQGVLNYCFTSLPSRAPDLSPRITAHVSRLAMNPIYKAETEVFAGYPYTIPAWFSAERRLVGQTLLIDSTGTIEAEISLDEIEPTASSPKALEIYSLGLEKSLRKQNGWKLVSSEAFPSGKCLLFSAAEHTTASYCLASHGKRRFRFLALFPEESVDTAAFSRFQQQTLSQWITAAR